jgi:hypothetical protein
VKLGREGPTIPAQLHAGLRSPNKTVTPVGTTTIHMARGTVCIDNAPNTSLMAMSRTFRCRHREKASEGSVQSPHWIQGVGPAGRPLGPLRLGSSSLGPRVKYTPVVMMILTFGHLFFVIS